jgi:5-methylcytosine-specific restriction endonuclease McrA
MPETARGPCPACAPAVKAADEARRRAKPSQAFYRSPAWRRVSALVRERDGCCVRCGSTERLMAHHRIPLAQLLAAGDIEAALDPDGCETLCGRCSGREDGARSWTGRMPRG